MNIRLKAIFITLTIFTVVLVLFLSYTFHYLSQERQKNLVHRAHETAEMIATTIESAIRQEEIIIFQPLTDRLIQHANLEFITIEYKGKVLAHSKRTGTAITDVTIAEQIIGSKEMPLGHIIIGYLNHNADSITTPIKQFVIWATLGIGLLTIVTMCIIMRVITHALRKVRKTNDSRHASWFMFYEDEVEATVNIVNDLHAKLDESNKKLQSSLQSQQDASIESSQIHERNKAIYSASLDAIIVANDQDVIIEFNSIAEQVFGWDRNDIIGRLLVDTLIPSLKRDAHIKGMQHFLNTGIGPILNRRIEQTAIRKSGREFPIEISISSLKNEQGYIFVSYVRDITQRLKDQTELKIAAHAFESSEAMFISDAKGHIIRTNPAFTEITGYKSEEVKGKKPRSLSANPEDSKFHKQVWCTLVDTGHWNGELTFRHSNGQCLPIRMSITAVTDESGILTHYVAYFFDMTEQKNNEKILRKAQRAAENANDSKSRFLATMSHEIRTPMNGVLGVLGLLRETHLNDEQLRLVQTARESGEILLAIINDVLDFSKMEAGKLILENDPFDMHELFQQTTDILRPQAKNRELILETHIKHGTPQYFIGDGDRIRQVLLNLLSNAIKYTQEGKVSVSIKSIPALDNTCALQIDVSDTGIGIEKEHLPTLFDEFTMAENTYDRRHEGSGLGLAICKQLVNIMQGDISVVSQVGKGSTFTFTLALALAEKGGYISTQSDDLPVEAYPSIDKHIRILLAEDNPANQVVLRTMLEFSGLSADIVSNGQEAVDAVSRLPYDIVLMDISMPEMDGVEATHRIRNMNGPEKDIIIIALTAHAIRGDKEHFLSEGMDDFISKPVTRKSILDCLSRWQPKCKTKANLHDENTNKADQQIINTQESLVNEAIITQLVSDTSAQVVPDLIVFYIEDAKSRVIKIVSAANATDYHSLEFEAHTLGGSAAAHGNSALAQLCRDIEQLCSKQNYDQALMSVKQLQITATNSFLALEQRLRQGLIM